MPYKTEQVNLGPLTRCFPGYYSEIFIQNSTKTTIVIIDSNNNKLNIPPISGNPIGRETVIIWKRNTSTPTVDTNNSPQQVPGLQIVIPLHDLNREGGYYIDEINMVLCTEANAVTAAHPKSSITFEDAADQARSKLIESIDQAPTLKLIANDPEGRYNKLYTVIGDMLVEINVTHIYGEAELQINYFCKGQQNTFNVDLNEFFNGENEILELQDLPLAFISTNKAKATRFTSEFKRVPQSEVDEILKKASVKAAKDIAAVKDQYTTELQLKDSEIKRLNDTIKNVNAENEQLETNIKELKAAIEAINTIREKEVKSQELANKARISNNNLNISSNDVVTSEAKRTSAETESKYKLWHIIAAASVPVAGTLAIELIKQQAAKNIATSKGIAYQLMFLL